MKKTHWKLTPVNGYDIPALEGWLARLCAGGLFFTMTLGPFTLFESREAQRLQIRLEPLQGPAEEDGALNALYEAAGWSYWGMFRGSYYVFATADLEAQAHTDPQIQSYGLGRFLRRKLTDGVLLALGGLLLLGLYRNGAPWELDLTWLRYFPVDTLSNGTTIPFLLALAGLLLVGLHYALGLAGLLQYRRTVGDGRPPKGRRRTGWLLAAGLTLLLPVMVNTFQLFSGLDYSPYPLEGSGFVTLADIQGPDLSLSGDPIYNMDYISHGGTLLAPERWYFRQYGSFSHFQGGVDVNDVPRLELSVLRYPLAALAEGRAEEWSRQYLNGSGDFQDLGAVHGLDQALYALREGWVGENGQVLQPGGMLILRRGNTVLWADYYGDRDLTGYLDQFVQMLTGL